MRPGEVIGLDRGDVDLPGGRVTVVSGKYGKSRELALQPSTVQALTSYALLRDRLCPRPQAPSFLVSTAGTRLLPVGVTRVFANLAHRVGLQPRSDRCRPSPMGLRHSFAVTTLADWYRAGADIDAHLPLLSTWLGHTNPTSTYWYLHAAPELLALAAERQQAGRKGKLS
jgi:integrase